MEVTHNIYFKSLNSVWGGLASKRYCPKTSSRVPCQSLGSMIENGVIVPNTSHSQLNDRLCASVITDKYRGGYRPEGVLFKAERDPDYCSPVDLMALTDGETFTSSDYNSKFFERAKELVFGSVDSMLLAYGSPEEAHKKLVEIRSSYGLKSPEKAFSYNECCFEGAVKITPVGLVGQSDAIAEAALKSGLVVYPNMETFVKYNSDSLPSVDYSVSLNSGSGELMSRMEEKDRKWDMEFGG